MSTLELCAVLFSLLGVWLTTRRTLWCWPAGLIAAALYARVFFDARLYSDMLLQGFFIIMQLYGWWNWRRGAARDGAVTVRRVSPRGWAAGMLAGALGTAALGGVMATMTDAAVPWLDAALTSFSLVGQLWTGRRLIESWWLWIVVDLIYTGLFLYKDLTLTAGLYAAFVVLAIIGLRGWRRTIAPPAAAGTALGAA